VGDARVEVPAVLAVPEERLPARDALDVVDFDAAPAQDVELLLAEVVADGADDADVAEEARRERARRRASSRCRMRSSRRL